MIVSRTALQDYAVSLGKKSWRGLDEAEIAAFKNLGTTVNYATADGTNTYNANSNGGDYYVSKEAFDPTVTPDVDPLIVPEDGRFSLSELLFIPPLNVAGELDVGLSIKTKQGSTEQAEATTKTFKLDVAAVADSPELKTPGGSEINPSQPIPKAGNEDEPGGIDLSNILKATTSGGDTVGTFLVYLKRPDDGSLTDYLVSRGLIEIDDGKVIPRLQLVDSDGNRIGQFIADTGANGGKGEFVFAVKASQTDEASFSPKIVFPNNFSTTEDGPVLLEIGAVSFLSLIHISEPTRP